MVQADIRHATGARAALRHASDAIHQRMHGLEPFAQIAAGTLPIDRYRLLLRSLYLVHAAVGRQARCAGWLHLDGSPQRLDLLRTDLACVGGAVPAFAVDWPAAPAEGALGALYTIEGSMFGSRVIAGQLDYAFGTSGEGRRFFIGDRQARTHWAQLIEVLEARCADQAALAMAITGALSTFALFELCVGNLT